MVFNDINVEIYDHHALAHSKCTEYMPIIELCISNYTKHSGVDLFFAG